MNTTQITLPLVDPISQWYKNNPVFGQLVRLTSDIIPDASFTAFTAISLNHTWVLDR